MRKMIFLKQKQPVTVMHSEQPAVVTPQDKQISLLPKLQESPKITSEAEKSSKQHYHMTKKPEN